MSEKLFEDLYLNTSGGSSPTGTLRAVSRAVSIGSHNGAMFEVTLKSANTLQSTGVRLGLEGSNDGQNWSAGIFGGGVTLVTDTGTTAPRYQAVLTTNSLTIPYSQLRMTAALVTPTHGTSQAAILDASLRTYQKA